MEFKPGTKCFAKVKGYSPWPARIDVLPKDVKVPRGKYPVFFYGTHEVSYVTAKDIFDFEKYQAVYGIYRERNSKFNDGIFEINNNPTIFQLGCDNRAVAFLKQFYKFDSEDLTETDKNQNKSDCSNSPPVPNRKRRYSTTENKEPGEPLTKSLKMETSLPSEHNEVSTSSVHHNVINNLVNMEDVWRTQEHESHSPEIKLDGTHSMENREVAIILKDVLTDIPTFGSIAESSQLTLKEENCEFVDNSEKPAQSKIENLNIILNSFKSPIKATYSDRPKRASALIFKQNCLAFRKSLSANQKHASKKPDTSSRLKKDHEKGKKSDRKHYMIEEKSRIKSKIKNCAVETDDLFIDHNQNQTVLANLPNQKENKAYLDENDLRTISKLSIIDKEIKRNLVVGNENHEKCRSMMNSLLDLNNLSLSLLCRVPEIVVTIRKCRRYKKDDFIKSCASKIFQNFFQIYDQAELEEKIEAGTELLKRDSSNCKSAQVLLDELFIVEKSCQAAKQKFTSLVLSSPSSAHSFHSSANNTPLLTNDTCTEGSETGCMLDPDLVDINELMKEGVLELIEYYSYEDANGGRAKKIKNENVIDDMELYKQLGV